MIHRPGMIFGEPNEVYHSNKAVSFSKLKTFQKRPSLYKKQHVDGAIVTKETDSLLIGSAAHMLVLEGHEAFESCYQVLPPDFNGRTKEGKELVEQIRQSGMTAIKPDVYSDLVAYRESVLSNDAAFALFSHGEPEITWRLKGRACDMQCRTDWYCDSAPADMDKIHSLLPQKGESYAVDYKTTQSLDDWVSNGWSNPVHKFGYAQQEAFYRFVINAIRSYSKIGELDRFYFVVTEKQEPRETAVFVVDTDTFIHAQAKIIRSISGIQDCFSSGIWPGFLDGGVMTTTVSEHVRNYA